LGLRPLEPVGCSASLGAAQLEREISSYYREQVWVMPSGMFHQNQLNHVVAELGAARIIYSEDFPCVIRDTAAESLELADLSVADKTRSLTATLKGCSRSDSAMRDPKPAFSRRGRLSTLVGMRPT
jgi:hypothetical protein